MTPQRRIWVFGLVTAVVLSIVIWRAGRDSVGPDPKPVIEASDVKGLRLGFASPHRNVRLEVRYVGSEACARCHKSHAESYSHHPMGQSIADISDAPTAELLAPSAGNPFNAGQYRYSVERRDGKMFHREVRLDAQGRALFSIAQEIQFVVGAGDHGRSYLIERDGSLFQSPIAWYPQRQTWALSPGYENTNEHFYRPIQTECLFCHSNFADHVVDTINRYAQPGFRGMAIGCERCHGPGQLHVAKQELGAMGQGPGKSGEEALAQEFDDTIVNPRDLSPGLRDAVCQQCHLGGAIRVTRSGRGWYDFRPGLPWDAFVSTFVHTSTADHKAKITGHVEQMHVSRCYQASTGKLGCISCHDPHVKLSSAERVSFYRQRCLTCHSEQSCSAPQASRLATEPSDNCISCHMPAIPTEIRHAAITDHRVPREADQPSTGRIASRGLSLINFHHPERADDADLQRDIGVAVVRLFDFSPELLTARDRTAAASYLEYAVKNSPHDADAQESLAHLWWDSGRYAESSALIDRLLVQSPRREFALHIAASQAQSLRQYDIAANLWRRVLDVNSAMYQYHFGLALSLGQQRQWGEAVAACRRVLEIVPDDSSTRQLLIECLLGNGETDVARSEFELLLRVDPDQTAELRAWFEKHPFWER